MHEEKTGLVRARGMVAQERSHPCAAPALHFRCQATD